MNARLHPTLALALLPMAPKGSVVHKVVSAAQNVSRPSWLDGGAEAVEMAIEDGLLPVGDVCHKPICDDRCAFPGCMGPAVDPKIQQDWDRALKLQQELPECLRGVL